MEVENPLSEFKITKLFTPSKNNENYIKARESTTIEYKESYNHGSMAQYLKTMAAFANTDGGYIIFGITDSPRTFKGLSDKGKHQFENIKIEEFTNNLNEYFQPSIKWANVIFEYRDKTYGIIYTYPLDNKPCICSKMYDDRGKKYSLEEGDIYYRYRGRSQKIKYAELQMIFDENKEKEAKKWIKLIENTAKIGISNASLLNLSNGEFQLDNSTIVMDKALVDSINFVKEGSFVENGGTPALKLMGSIKDIQSFDGIVVTTPKLKAIEPSDIIIEFLRSSVVDSPIEFIKVIMNCNSGFQPIYYYIKQSERDIDWIKKFINDSGKDTQTIKLLISRLNGRLEKKQELKSNESEANYFKRRYFNCFKDKKITNDLSEFLEEKHQIWLLQSFMYLDDMKIIENEAYYKSILLELYEKLLKNKRGNVASCFRKAICRLDEVLFFSK